MSALSASKQLVAAGYEWRAHQMAARWCVYLRESVPDMRFRDILATAEGAASFEDAKRTLGRQVIEQLMRAEKPWTQFEAHRQARVIRKTMQTTLEFLLVLDDLGTFDTAEIRETYAIDDEEPSMPTQMSIRSGPVQQASLTSPLREA